MACANCVTGDLTTATPTGTETTLFSTPTYVANPAEGTTPKATIIFFPDAFGWDFANNRVLADRYAQRTGMRVLVPDFMNGAALPQWCIESMKFIMNGKGIWNWILKPFKIVPVLLKVIQFRRNTGFPTAMPKIHAFIRELRASSDPVYASAPLGAAGFCWGAKPAFLLAKEEKSPLAAIFTGHPSFLDVPGDIEAVKVPSSIAVGDTDMRFKPGHVKQTRAIWESEEWVAKSKEGKKPKTELKVYDGATHGFCVRAEIKYEQNVDAAVKAEDQAVNWFLEHLK